jgi:DNA topoisomerase-1
MVLTDLGKTMVKFAVEHFDNLFNYQFTGQLEARMNAIEEGKESWVAVVRSVYDSYQPKMTMLLTDRTQVKKFQQKRVLGQIDGQEVIAYLGKFGPVIQVVESGGQPNQGLQGSYYKIEKPITLETVTLEDAQRIIAIATMVPRVLGAHGDRSIILKKGQYGYYLNYGDGNYPLKPEYFQPELANVQEVLAHVDTIDVSRIIADMTKPKYVQVGPFQIYQGKFGPYFKAGQLNVAIPRAFHSRLDTITEEQCLTWIETRQKRKKNDVGSKK